MPKQFVPGTKVQALFKTVFGEKEAKRVHPTDWKTAIISGVISQESAVALKKVCVEWEDSANNLRKTSEHGVQTFILDKNCNGGGNTQKVSSGVLPASIEASQNVSAPESAPQSKALFSHPAARPRFQIPRSKSLQPQNEPVSAPERQESVDNARVQPQSSTAVQEGPSESDDNDSDKAQEDFSDAEEEEEEKVQANASGEKADPLLCHGLQWHEIEGISIDEGTKPHAWNSRIEWPSDMDVPPLHKRSAIWYWKLMLPACMREILKNSNKHFIENGLKPITPSELMVFWGCVFAISLYGGRVGARRMHWSEPTSSTMFPGLNLGRFMGRKRFEELLSNILWGYAESHPSFDENDLWWPVRQLVNANNARRKQVVRPGVLLTGDETGTKWKGREYQGRPDFVDGAPKISVQLRKPEPVHIEVKDLCCAKSRIMLHMELQEEEMAKLTTRGQNVSTACTLRLVRNWSGGERGKGHILLADSWFAGVETAVALKNVGVDFIGPVKTCTRKFPKKYLQVGPSRDTTILR